MSELWHRREFIAHMRRLNYNIYIGNSRLVCVLVTRGLINLQAVYQRNTEWDTTNILHVIDEEAAVEGDSNGESTPGASFALA